ncbi:MAG: DNA-directed polymerase subunit sigma [Chloroflexi bacterium]|nr:DNA-directed polymerase subunit sigma [Chloroflexota bacterium]
MATTAPDQEVTTQAPYLVEQARRGDLRAFDRLVERYQDAMFGAAYAMLGNFHDAEDVAQQAFIQAWRELANLQEPARFPGWLYRITQNLARNKLTRETRDTAPIESVDWARPAPAHDHERDTAEAVHEAIGALSEANRLATMLFYIGGYSIDEVAGILGIPAGTVKRRLHDARKALRTQMVGHVRHDLQANRPSQDRRFTSVVTLINAAWTGDLAMVKTLLQQGPSLVNARDANGWMPLHHAARHGHAHIVDVLLNHNADPQAAEDAWGWTPLHLAEAFGYPEVAQRLQVGGATVGLVAASGLGKVDRVTALIDADPRLVDAWGQGSGPLHWAAYHGHVDVVERLLAAGADIHARARNSFANTALHCAALHGHADAVHVLLRHGADPHIVDGYGATAVHAVAKYPHGERASDGAVLDLLLTYGAAIDVTNDAGETALHWAITRGERSVASLLLARGARLDIFAAAALGDLEALARFVVEVPEATHKPGPDRMTPLHYAAYANNVAAARYLLEHGAEVEARGGWFFGSPLHLAVYQGHREMAAFLLDNGANPNARDAASWTPLHQFRSPTWTVRHDDRAEIAGMLLAQGATCNARTDLGETPLHWAAHTGNTALATVLLENGAQLEAHDHAGLTPLQWAARQNHYEIGNLLSGQSGPISRN